MAKITITINVDGSVVSREYEYADYDAETWGYRVRNILDTIENSKEIPF